MFTFFSSGHAFQCLIPQLDRTDLELSLFSKSEYYPYSLGSCEKPMLWVLIMHFELISGDLDFNASASILYNNIIEMIYNLFTRCNKNHFRLKFLLIMLIIKNKNFFSKYSVFKFECIFCVIGISKLNGTLRRRLHST